MTTQTNISHEQKDKDYIIKLMNQAKLKEKIPLNTSFSALAIDCMVEYLEHKLDIKQNMYCIVYPVDKSLVYIIYRLYNVTKGDNQP